MAQSVQEKNSLCSLLLPSSLLLMNAFTSSSFSLASAQPLASCHFLYSLVSFLSTLLFCCAFVCVYDCVCWFPCTKAFPAEVYKSLLWRSALTFFINLLLPATLHTWRWYNAVQFWVEISMFCKNSELSKNAVMLRMLAKVYERMFSAGFFTLHVKI